LAALLFGLSTPIAKLLLPGAGPFLLSGLLYLGSGLALSIVGAIRGPGGEAPIGRRDLLPLAGMVVAGGVVGPVLFLLGLARLPGSSAALLLNLEAPFTIALAVAIFGEALTAREAGGAGAIVVGGLVLSLSSGFGWLPPGALAVAAACACWALDNNLAARLALRDPVAVVRAKSLVAGAVSVGLGLLAGERLPSLTSVPAALGAGALGYGLSIVLHLRATRELGAARQGALFATAPFAGALGAFALLGERPGLRELAAAAAMALGVALLLGARHGHRHGHEALEHDHAHVHDEHHLHPHPHGTPEPHTHLHRHGGLVHDHPHVSDAHHRHDHEKGDG
jgi:drug/metabolite transporter (DMT)-like permease